MLFYLRVEVLVTKGEVFQILHDDEMDLQTENTIYLKLQKVLKEPHRQRKVLKFATNNLKQLEPAMI